jgi:dienelactone hydrolase
MVMPWVATLIVDSFTPRHDDNGVCDRTQDMAYYVRRAEDAHAAMAYLRRCPTSIRSGFSLAWANAATLVVNDVVPSKHAAKFAGVIAYYPYCVTDMQFSVRTVVFVGDKDDWTPAKLCDAIKDKPNLEVVVYPGATDAFAMTHGI